jgi:hypothetical protein
MRRLVGTSYVTQGATLFLPWVAGVSPRYEFVNFFSRVLFVILNRVRAGTGDTTWKKLSASWGKEERRKPGGTETGRFSGASSPFLNMVHGVLR